MTCLVLDRPCGHRVDCVLLPGLSVLEWVGPCEYRFVIEMMIFVRTSTLKHSQNSTDRPVLFQFWILGDPGLPCSFVFL
ncbi:hypothetical protein DPMN_187670 [Dreissena polymorpha]|uniref:Uncharacterized protein n=1 Tax=Dreissena polymorpha TaxID=45954 RepID=A0A9D4I995_DREPO|nr:hypothetical protein DPMN_187670 [Dreissena polymorpha]